MTAHEMFDGRVQIYKRGRSRYWQCAARVADTRHRESTKCEHLDQARDFAEEWYLDLRGKLRRSQIVPNGEALKEMVAQLIKEQHLVPEAPPPPPEHTFQEAYEEYLREVKVLTLSTRSPKYVNFLELRMKRHVLPYFGAKPLSQVNRGLVQRYRAKRAEDNIALTKTDDSPGYAPARSTMLQEIVHIRQILKHAEGLGWITTVPNLSTPYMTQGKRGRRAWFSPEEYKQLYKATRKRIEDCPRPGYKSRYEDTHDFVLFMANTGLRPDEALRLQYRDVQVEKDVATGTTILVIDVRGKTGVGYCKSMPGAVMPFERLRKRRAKQLKDAPRGDEAPRALLPTDLIFPKFHRELFNNILDEEGLKTDRDGQTRTAYSLRHTYISMRLMEGANIHQIANNCRTSVQMIEQFYASHIKDRLDTASINVERPKAVRKASSKPRGKVSHEDQHAP